MKLINSSFHSHTPARTHYRFDETKIRILRRLILFLATTRMCAGRTHHTLQMATHLIKWALFFM